MKTAEELLDELEILIARMQSDIRRLESGKEKLPTPHIDRD
jgi:hypothetical protein